ncbi:hypothetical protein [Lactonifactor longoviformis]|uniref:hypothetical protein n=1 Tax=Lactonifactor longoviformis TaxID=341220 RepID=UPI001D016782|nr:hypothetical protein [Lactonifactor longoviformis]MCB5712134.1 hypothetical protein [Lactonifactor longoviformis]MCB5716178.1 hypothetical protein [Lactonifactor longoviformis]
MKPEEFIRRCESVMEEIRKDTRLQEAYADLNFPEMIQEARDYIADIEFAERLFQNVGA